MEAQSAVLQKQAPCADRCIAYIIDDIVTSVLCCTCIGAPLYACFKDGIRDGQSFGKGAMGLRVVKLNTGVPASIGDSCIRNFCELCPCILLFTEGKRRVGDLFAGTIVIKDI